MTSELHREAVRTDKQQEGGKKSTKAFGTSTDPINLKSHIYHQNIKKCQKEMKHTMRQWSGQ